MCAKEKCKSCFGDYKCHVPTGIKDSKGRIVYVDKCIKEAVENLNKMGFKTVASCCGHGIINPVISIENLSDGKNLNNSESNCAISGVSVSLPLTPDDMKTVKLMTDYHKPNKQKYRR